MYAMPSYGLESASAKRARFADGSHHSLEFAPV